MTDDDLLGQMLVILTGTLRLLEEQCLQRDTRIAELGRYCWKNAEQLEALERHQ